MTLSKIKFYGLLLVVLIFGLTNFTPKSVYAASASLVPLNLGNNNDWLVNTGSKVDAVTSNDSGTSFISASSTGASQTFSFPGAGVPAGATINFVTLTAFSKADANVFGSPQIIFKAENGVSAATDSAIGHLVTNSLAYSAFSWKMIENPLTHAPWTEAEVNSWTTNFGVTKSGLFGLLQVTSVTLSVDFSVHELPAVNPVLANQTCGLDIALVLDNSGSIGGNLPAEKSAFNSFVNQLLPATPTYFSVTYFDGVANYALSNFSNSQSSIISAISGVPGSSGQTNWEDALIKAGDTFDPRPGTDHPNLIIFASDGQPNRYGPNGSLGVGGTVDLNALDAAVAQANIIKNSGTRIITLGIGGNVNQANMEAISSADAYYSVSDFSQLAATLNTIAGQMCGSTVTATKIIDQDGNLQTVNDQTPGVAWQFNVGGSAQITDSAGKTAAVALSPGTYSVSETAQIGFSLISAGCSGATNNGTASGTNISGLVVNGNDIVSCVFYNKPLDGGGGGGSASSSDISILKIADKTSANVGDTVNFTLVVKNTGTLAATGVVASDTLPSTLTFVSATSTQGIYSATTSLWNIGNLGIGASATTTITAIVKSGTAGLTINNTGTASSTSSDANPLNNSSSVTVTVNSPGGGGGGVPSADLSIVKTVSNTSPNPGDIITYTLVVKNSGPNTADNVTATDTLSSILTFISSTSTQGSFSPTTSVWTLGTLLNGQSATTTIVATVNAGSAGQSITNSAVVGSTTIDPNPDNNISTAGLVVPTPPSGGGGGGSSGGGGGGSSGGGGSGGGGGLPIVTPVILGASTGTVTSLPIPQVLGETLPRTGMPAGFEVLLIVGLIGIYGIVKKTLAN